jgi:ubiquinone/menaquinone biosynthesis C-methylase UbiE
VPTPPSLAGYWDAAAGSFDEQADHGLRDPRVRDAWARRLRAWLPGRPADVLDLGCGTGSLLVLLAEQGHRAVGLDLAPGMLGRARAKLDGARVGARLLVADAGDPPLAGRRFEVVLARHLLWTLPDPHAALRRWVGLVGRGGRLVLVEGRWDGPAGAEPYAAGAEAMPWLGGVPAEVLTAALEPLVSTVRTEPLTSPALWGRVVPDDRYAVVAEV